MRPNPGPGKLIAIEGLDGAGTTTQVRMLEERLGGSREVFVTFEPSSGPVGLQIRMILEHRVRTSSAALAALFAADRMDHLFHRDGDGGIVGHLERGIDVITDRYYLSSFAYQGLSLDWEWIWHMHDRCLCPDVTLFVDVPVEVCLDRIARGRGGQYDLFENQQALSQVRQSYLRAIERLRQAGDRIEVVDGDAPPDRVHAALYEIASGLFEGAHP
jgi:dTMP kinase